jgi:excisionase family DNA binding protein
MDDKLLSISQATKFLNISRASIDRWQAKGLISPTYTPGGHRRFKKSDLLHVLGLKEETHPENRAVIYARVSTRKQAETGNLVRQEERLIAYAVKSGYQVVLTVTEIASGLNERRKKLNKALQMFVEGKADILVIEFEDRLARFGYKFIEMLISSHGGRIDVVQSNPEMTPNEELVNDLISIVTSFSARIYGQRGGQVAKKVKAVLRESLDDS